MNPVIVPAFPKSVSDALARPFAANEIKSDVRRHTDGWEPTYVDAPTVIKRLNEAFDAGGWRHEIVGEPMFFPPSQSGQPPQQVIVRVRLTVEYDCAGQRVVASHEQFGSCFLKINRNQAFVDAGADMKAAVTDGIKKCATYFGIALDLYVKDEAPMQGLYRKDAVAQHGTYPAIQANPAAPAEPFQIAEVKKMFERLGIGDPQWWQGLGLTGPQLTQGQVADLLVGKHPWVAQLMQKCGVTPGLAATAA